MSDPTFSVIDLLIASGAGATILVRESAPGWFVLPGVFAVSGVISTIYVARCRSELRSRKSPPLDPNRVLYKDAPIYENEAPQPALSPETSDPERGSGPSLRLPTDYRLPESETSLEGSGPKRISCSLDSLDDCPEDHVCMIIGGTTGFCEPDGADKSRVAPAD